MLRSSKQAGRTAIAVALSLGLAVGWLAADTASTHAAFTAPGLIKDINENLTGQADRLASDPTIAGANFDPGHNVFASASGAPYQLDEEGVFNGNQVLVITQDGLSAGDGAGFTLSVSNGENGDGLSGTCVDPGCALTTTDPTNTFNGGAPDPVFNTIGNTTGRLEDGNVIRFSTWVRNDPNAPMSTEPQIAPIIKLEFWRDALTGDADFTGGVPNPAFGNRIFDTDQNDIAIADPADRKRVVDIDGDGVWSFGATTEPVPLTTAWQQIVHTYEVNSVSEGWDILDTGGVTEDVTHVEEIRGVLFYGDFAGSDLTGPENLLWDNALIEIFADTSAEAASDVMVSNPDPANDELPGDLDGDGDVDGEDYVFAIVNNPALIPEVEANFPVINSGASAVPEPTAVALVLAGVVCMSGTIRRRS